MTTKQKKEVARPEDERLPIGATIGYGIQHVLTMYGGIIAPPLIIGQIAGLKPGEIGVLIAACLFMGGLATILQTVGVPFFGSQLPPSCRASRSPAWRPWAPSSRTAAGCRRCSDP